jgi:acetylserotonin N-methyltransferase
MGSWASGQLDMERARRVAAAMQSHSLPAAIALARNGGFEGVRRLLDVGAGSGCFAIALAQQHPELSVSIMELPAMCQVAQEYIDAAGATGRVDTVAVDMFREPWPRGYDAMFFSNVFHDWNFETCRWLAERASEALEPGGRIYLHEMLLDDDGGGPVTTVSFSMLMLGTQGQQFTLPELRGLLEPAGFRDIEARPTYGYYSLVTGRKAG